MIFVAAYQRNLVPQNVLDHIVRAWRDPVPFDKDIFVVDPSTLECRRVKGDFYAGLPEPKQRRDRRNHGRII